MNINILGGGTISYIRNHLALSAPSYGTTAKYLNNKLNSLNTKYNVILNLTKMASQESSLETNEDVSNLIDNLLLNDKTKIIFFNSAIVDFSGEIGNLPSGKYQDRLRTSEGLKKIKISPTDKIISKIRKTRKDIFLVAFKTTCGATEDEQFIAGLSLLKNNSCNLVVANDTKTRKNMIITPEQSRYCVSTDRNYMLDTLIDMTLARANGKFTRSTVIDGKSVDWNSEAIPNSLREVVNYCINKNAYKPFNNTTVGHFAVKVDDKTFLTSKRKSNFNNLNEVGLVKVEALDSEKVIAHGAKPSVGGQSQRIIFKNHPEKDCIVHFHCKLKTNNIPIASQFYNECGSHQCGENTSNNLKEVVPGIKCVYLDNHGPNIVFNKNIDPNKVIDFIDKNFDLSKSTSELNYEF